MSTVYQPISISKNVKLVPSALALAIHILIKRLHPKLAFFHKKCYLDQVFQYKSYCIYTSFPRKSYFIFRKNILYFKIFQRQH